MNKESAKRHVTKKDSDESIEIYLGEDNLKYMHSITPEEYDLFTSFNLSTKKSYFVKGTEKLLKKFKAFFIALCSFERYSYATAMLKEYIEGLSDKSDEMTSILGVERELLFLYLHREASGVGGTDAWLCTAAIDRVANRDRKGLVTVILSERAVPAFEASKELKTINLGKFAKAISEVAEASKENSTSGARAIY